MRTAVDTNVLLDLLAGDKAAIAASRSALAEALAAGSLVICPVVYAELSASFPDPDTLDRFLNDLQIKLDDFSRDALVKAAISWRQYTRNRGRETRCPRCGYAAQLRCPSCGAQLSWRQHIIPDFLVGGHAAAQADRLLTRDLRYFRRYFPEIDVVEP